MIRCFNFFRKDLGLARNFSATRPHGLVVVRKKNLTITNDITVVEDKHSRTTGKVLSDLKRVKKKTKRDTTDVTSRSNILFLEVKEALAVYNINRRTNIKLQDVLNSTELIDKFLFSRKRPEIIIPSVEIVYQTSEGSGLGFIPKSMYASALVEDELYNQYTAVVVPKTLVGDRVKIKLTLHDKIHSEGVLLEVVNSKQSKRKDNLILCNHFDECNGCQLQMLPYEEQLSWKQSMIHRAYRFFFPDLLKEFSSNDFGRVNPSPMQYAYRTKFTPHFDYPRDKSITQVNIGLKNVNPSKKLVDIDNCMLLSPALNQGYRNKKKQVLDNLAQVPTNKMGKQNTLFFRESVNVNFETGETSRYCVSDHTKLITEQVEDKLFQFKSASFFQTNNVILPLVLDFVRHHMQQDGRSYKYLVDTYCGSGFFGISLAKYIADEGKVFGIEIDSNAIDYATKNAKLNGIDPSKVQFIEGNAESMFKSEEFKLSGISGRESVVIMDPSRKGSDLSFLKQLYDFKPSLIIYVSCNVYTQARDLENFLQIQGETKYKVRDVVGFDFFPQTKHVETIAVLEIVK